jgi:Flp pilus assembly protein TadG
MRIFRRFITNRKGSAAIEFAILALPFMVLIFAIVEIALMFFIDSGLDAALHKTVRQVRVGTAKNASWSLATFKSTLCGQLSYSFSCSSSLLVRAVVVTDMSSVTKTNPIVNGQLSVSENFNIGGSGDYVLIQAFLPYDPVLKLYAFAGGRLTDGRYVLGAAELFKNEPF